MRRLFAVLVPLLIALPLLWVGHAQNPTAPTVDNVGFPDGYQSWNLFYVFDRPDNKQIRTVYGNNAAASVADGGQASYPYGSIVVMETWAALKDADGNAILDSNGRFQKDPAATPTIFAMRKEKGFGVAYAQNRNGEWEYVSYTPAKAFATAPANSFTCAICHLQAGQGKDWVFRGAWRFKGSGGAANGAVPAGVIKNYSFVPGVLTVKNGSTITFYNDDVVAHTIADDFQGGWISPLLKAGSGTVALTFNQPGEFAYHCSIHPNMKGRIIVVP